MTETGTPYRHSPPELYDRYMGPLLFEPSRRSWPSTLPSFSPDRILETAAGTGIVTQALHRALAAARSISIPGWK